MASRFVHVLRKDKFCYPQCESFRCGQRALTNIGKRVYCRWAEDDCVGYTCNYSICTRRRLLPSGICSFSVKRKTTEEAEPETIKIDPEITKVKIKGKLLRRFKEDELI